MALLIQEAGAPVWLAMLLSLALAVAVGVFNGMMVIKTKLPSFIVTLGTFFIVQGAGLGFTRLISGQTTIYLSDQLADSDWTRILFASTPFAGIRIPVYYWIVITALATFVLLRSKYGNWVFSVGGDAASSRAVGVPVNRVKIALFVNVSVSAWLVAMFNTFRFESAQIGTGVGLEFEFIIAAVIGGCLLTGGYGSAIGAAIGALIFEMVRQGLAFARWEADWFKLFLGLMLLGAALLNQFVRVRAQRARS
jgi:simple sugar transport system permease protein